MKHPEQSIGRKSGQAIIFLVVVMVVGLLVVLWNFDLHNTISTKIRVGNAGDAAALSAARWQGITMNMVGELNLIQAAVLLEDPANSNSVETISELRDRISLNGPLMGFVAAQSAAFLNLKEKDERRVTSDYDTELMERAQEFQASAGGLYHGRVAEAYDGAWGEYGNLLAAIASGDMIVGCGNTRYFIFYDGHHILLNPYFYEAVAAGYWCWFKDHYRYLLTDYTDYSSWPPLPPLDERPPINSEYFGTDLRRTDTLLAMSSEWAGDMSNRLGVAAAPIVATRVEQFEDYLEVEPNTVIAMGGYAGNYIEVVTNSYRWHFYDEESWLNRGRWPAGPFRDGITIKPEFNYRGGADAAVDVYLTPYNLTPGMHIDYDDIRWIAAAKPFGWLDATNSVAERQMPHYFGVVLPAYRQARLIPNNISSRTMGVSSLGWDAHIYEHLPDYVSQGLEAIEDNRCYYCSQLRKWENPDLRFRGDQWLKTNHDNPPPDRCYDPRGSFDTGQSSDWR